MNPNVETHWHKPQSWGRLGACAGAQSPFLLLFISIHFIFHCCLLLQPLCWTPEFNELARNTPSFKGRRDAVLSGGSTKLFLTFDYPFPCLYRLSILVWVNMTRVQVTQGIFSLALLFSPFPLIGGSKQKMVQQPLVQYSSTLGLTSCHLATLWPLVLYFPSKCQLLCHSPNSQKSVCAHPCCFLVSVSVSYDVSLWWFLKFHEARRGRKKEGCCDLRADSKTGYFFYV